MSTTCARCASDKIIPGLRWPDRWGDIGVLDSAKLEVAGNPKAWLFTDKISGELRAYVCGECGYVEIRVKNHQAVYRKYLKAAGGKPGG